MKRHIKAGDILLLWMINHEVDPESPERKRPTDAVVVRTHRNYAFVIEPDAENGFGRLYVDQSGVSYEYKDRKKCIQYCAVIIEKADGTKFDATSFIED